MQTIPPGNTPPVLTVSQLNRQVKSLLESHFDFVWVGGEIGNFSRPSSGHWYFSLKDDGAQVRCAMFRNANQRLRYVPKQGDEVRARCRVSLYEGRGEYQLIVEYLEPAGAGNLQAAFEQLKAKLLAEGLFDPARKQPLPTAIRHIGVITSPTGAAIHDILTVLRRRSPGIAVSLLPVPVQGADAAPQIAAAIARANRWQQAGLADFDVLVVGRGGGSLEDLQAFNEEAVARAIAASTLPVVSAVGHEIDFTIADMVADVRAPTPSAAAELLSPDQTGQRQHLHSLRGELSRQMLRRVADAALRLEHLQQRVRHPGAVLREQAQRIDELEQRMIGAQRHALERRRLQLQVLRGDLFAQSPERRVRALHQELGQWRQRLGVGMRSALREQSAELARLAQVMASLSPLGILARGYAILTDGDGAILRRAGAVRTGQSVRAQLAEGSLRLTVDEVEADRP